MEVRIAAGFALARLHLCLKKIMKKIRKSDQLKVAGSMHPQSYLSTGISAGFYI